MNNTIDITLSNVNIDALTSALEPAIILDNKITLNIDLLHKNAIYGVSGGHDKYKFWSTQMTTICKNVTTSDDFDNAFNIKAVILNTKHLLGIIKTLAEDVSLTFHSIKKSNVYECIALTIATNSISVRYACALIAVDEIINSRKEHLVQSIKFYEYWTEVKKEVERL
jgi:hypothetical protein